jgi:predicted nucleic acid-binding protein
MNYFFDTYAIIEIIKGNPNYEFANESTIITSVMNLSELYYALLLENKKEFVDMIIKKLNLQFIEISSEIATQASHFRYKNKKLSLSYIDCLGYILAINNNLTFLTGDKGFKDIEHVKFVKK